MESPWIYMNKLAKFTEVTAVIAMVLLWLVMLLNTSARYLFDYGAISFQEFVTYMMIITITFGIPTTMQKNQHVRIDVISKKLPPRVKPCLGNIEKYLLIIAAAFLIWINFDYAEASWQLKESSPEPGGLAWLFLIKQCVIILPMLMILAAFWLKPTKLNHSGSEE